MDRIIPDDSISIQFPRQQWEHILVILARNPFNEVAPVIGEMQRQFQMAEAQRRAPQARGNGQAPAEDAASG
jgi:hypothetical protein